MEILPAKNKYAEKVIPEMKKSSKHGNYLALPQIKKAVINVGIGKIAKENEKIEEIFNSISEIAGQRPVKTKARKAISGFKVREGTDVGIKATLRGKRMWDFIDRLVNFAIPRTKDFQGINLGSVDSRGNLNLGIKEHIIFPEIVPEKVKNIFSFQITIVTSAKDKESGIEMFRLLGFPLKEK